jgi:hypothetical protein
MCHFFNPVIPVWPPAEFRARAEIRMETISNGGRDLRGSTACPRDFNPRQSANLRTLLTNRQARQALHRTGASHAKTPAPARIYASKRDAFWDVLRASQFVQTPEFCVKLDPWEGVSGLSGWYFSKPYRRRATEAKIPEPLPDCTRRTVSTLPTMIRFEDLGGRSCKGKCPN